MQATTSTLPPISVTPPSVASTPSTPRVNKAPSSPSFNPIFGDSPSDEFLKFCFENGLLDHHFIYTNATNVSLEPLNKHEINKIIELLSKQHNFTIILNKAKKDEIREKLRFYRNEDDINAYPYLNNNEEFTLTCSFTLINLFYYLIQDPLHSKYSGNDNILLIGGFVRVLLKDWFRRSIVQLKIPETIIPENLYNQKAAPDTDFRYFTGDRYIDQLNLIAQNYLTSLFFPNVSRKTQEVLFNSLRDIIKEGGCKTAQARDFQTKVILFSNISFLKYDLSFLHSKPIRRHLLSQDALQLKISSIAQAILRSPNKVIIEKKKAPIPDGGSDQDTWQAIFDYIANLIHVHDPKGVNAKGWLRFLAAVTKLGRCPVSVENIEDRISSILFKTMLEQRNFEGIVEQTVKDVIKYHDDHHEGNSLQLIALIFNIFHDLRKRGVDKNALNAIWEKLSKYLSKQTEDNQLFNLLRNAVQAAPQAIDALLAFVQVAAFLKAHRPKENSQGVTVYLTQHEGDLSLQIVQGPALLLKCDLIEAMEILEMHSENLPQELFSRFIPVLQQFLPSTQIPYQSSTQVSRNLNVFPENSINIVVEKTIHLLKRERTPIAVKKLCYQLLMSLHSLDKKLDYVIPYLLEQFLIQMNLEEDPSNRERLIDQIEHLLKNSKYVSNIPSNGFVGIRKLLKSENLSEELLADKWIKSLVSTQDPELKDLAISMWKKHSPTFPADLKKESRLTLLQILARKSEIDAFSFFSNLRSCEFLNPEEEFEIFTKTFIDPLDLTNIDTPFFKILLVKFKGVFTNVVASCEDQGDASTSIIPSEKLAAFFSALIKSDPSDEHVSLLTKATELGLIPPESPHAVKAWIFVCSNALNSLKHKIKGHAGAKELREISQTWQFAVKQGVPINQDNSLKTYFFISDFSERLSSFDHPEMISLGQQYSDMVSVKTSVLMDTLEAQEVLKLVGQLFPGNPHQAMSVLLHFITLPHIDKEKTLEFFLSLLAPYLTAKDSPTLPKKTLLLISSIFRELVLNDQKPTDKKKEKQGKTPIQYCDAISWCINELSKCNEWNVAKQLLIDANKARKISPSEVTSSWLLICQCSFTESQDANLAVALWNEAKASNVWNDHQSLLAQNAFLVSLCKKLVENQDSSSKEFLAYTLKNNLTSQQKEELNLFLNDYFQEQLSTAIDKTAYTSLEDNLILSPEQQHLLNLEKFKIDIKEQNWKSALQSFPLLVKECRDSSEQLLLISFLKQIFQKLPLLKFEELNLIESLLRKGDIKNLFEDTEEALIFLLDQYQIVKQSQPSLNIAFIDCLLKQVGSKNSLSSETSSRIALFFISVIRNPGPIRNSIVNELKSSLPRLIYIFNADNGPHIFDLCRLLSAFPLHSIEISYSKKMIDSVLSIFISALENYQGNEAQLESIHLMFELLKWSSKEPISSIKQIQAYTLLIEKLSANSKSLNFSKYVDSWIIRVIVNLKAVELKAVTGENILRWCKKLEESNKIDQVKFLASEVHKFDFNEVQLVDFIILLAQNFLNQCPMDIAKLLLKHSSALKSREAEFSLTFAFSSAQKLLQNSSFEALNFASLLIEQYPLLENLEYVFVIEQLYVCPDPRIGDSLLRVFLATKKMSTYSSESYISNLQLLIKAFERFHPLYLFKLLEDFSTTDMSLDLLSNDTLLNTLRSLIDAIKRTCPQDKRFIPYLLNCDRFFIMENKALFKKWILEAYSLQENEQLILEGLQFFINNLDTLSKENDLLELILEKAGLLLNTNVQILEEVAVLSSIFPKAERLLLKVTPTGADPNRFFLSLNESIKSKNTPQVVSLIEGFNFKNNAKEKQNFAELFLSKILEFLFTNPQIFQISGIIISQAVVCNQFLANDYAKCISEYLHKKMGSATQEELKNAHFFNFIYNFIIFLHGRKEDATQIYNLINNFLFIECVHQQNFNREIFEIHLNFVEKILEGLTSLSGSEQSNSLISIVLCKAYIGDSTFKTDILKAPESLTIVNSVLSRLINSPSLLTLYHFFMICPAFLEGSKHDVGFANFYLPLFIANHCKSGLPTYERIKEAIFLEINPDLFPFVVDNSLTIFIQICVYENSPPILLKSRDFCEALIKSKRLNGNLTRLYNYLENVAPFFLRNALAQTSQNFSDLNPQFNLSLFFEINCPHNEEETLKRGSLYYHWLSLLIKSRNPIAMRYATTRIRECTRNDHLFPGLPANLQEKIK